MKNTTKLALAAIAAFLSLASSGFANNKVDETADYNIVTIQPGNGQPVTIYVPKAKAPATTVALDVHGACVSCSSAAPGLRLQSRDNGHGQQVFQYVHSSIN